MKRRTLLSSTAAVGIAAVVYPSIVRAASNGPALFLAAHQDDELWAAVSIAEHVAAGQDVHVAFLTSGQASGAREMINGSVVSGWWKVQHSPEDEGYEPLTVEEFGVCRDREAENSVRALGTGYPGTVTTHYLGLVDGSLATADAQNAILGVADLINPGGPVRLKGHSHLVDDSPDHRAVGNAMRNLKALDPARFGDIRHYVLPSLWTDPRLSQVSESWDLPTDAGITSRVRNAIRCYEAWAPQAGSYAIGGHSVPGLMEQLRATPKSMMHL